MGQQQLRKQPVVLEIADRQALNQAVEALDQWSNLIRCPTCGLWSLPRGFCPRCEAELVNLNEAA